MRLERKTEYRYIFAENRKLILKNGGKSMKNTYLIESKALSTKKASPESDAFFVVY